MGEAEGPGANWHGHVTALSIAPDYRRLGLAAKLMSGLEEIAEKYKSTINYLTQPSPTPLNFVFQETGLLCRLVCPRLQHCRHQHVQESRLHHLPNSPWILFRFTRWRRLRYKISILKTQINSTNRLILCRHEKGVISRCKQRVSHSVNSSCTAWRYRLNKFH